jgi:RimJ/RimL family protein N-acetyltransferase
VSNGKSRTHEGSTLRLVRFSLEDIDTQYIGWLNDDEVTRYLSAGLNDNSYESLVASFLEKDNDSALCFFVIWDRFDAKKIGTCTLQVDHENKTASYGYLIGEKQYWGGNAGIECQILLLEYAFSQLYLRKVCGGVVSDNLPSMLGCKRLGFSREGIRRKQLLDSKGSEKDVHQFGILRHEWLKTRARFQQLLGSQD